MAKQQLPQLFLMHYAGGNIYSLNFLKKELENSFDVIGLELPGRGKRMGEKLLNDRKSAVNDQLQQIRKHLYPDIPFAIYGHSMGALLGFEIVKSLESKNIMATCLIATGNSGPGTLRDELRYKLPKKEFIEALKELGGIPDEVYETEELFDFFEPVLRADFEIVEHPYEISANEKISCPVYCAMGSDEKYVYAIDNWKNYTTARFESMCFSGNHFFINEHFKELTEFIKKAYYASVVL